MPDFFRFRSFNPEGIFTPVSLYNKRTFSNPSSATDKSIEAATLSANLYGLAVDAMTVTVSSPVDFYILHILYMPQQYVYR